VKNVRKVTNLVNEIANASQEQSEGVGQVGKAISQMDQVIQQNAANAEETASASEELSAQANSLLSLVDKIAGEVGNKKEEETKENKPLVTKKPSAKNERIYYKPSKPDKKTPHNRLNDEHIVHMKRNGNGHGNGKKTLPESDADEIFPMDEKAFKDF
jgi:methyl-accepting chemotaxis protein